ncbi:5'-adenylylsulfate reductase-like 5 [Apostasia shenzhenica]|uniref:5'-adenylylsulfate reductase-like 5 n=1 Tax=Apostasia shenzhenica TaxID=1088818 RepID=A0A2I0A1B5_9ASPA|nr:5'-adenylylsulfate reductase-like 5 [Apostasia shenzhenica]
MYQIRGDTLDEELGHVKDDAYYSVLFYASWCPFSLIIRPIFDALSSMFPHIRHLIVEESSAMPRYGVHSFPSILLANKTGRIRYHGSKDLYALMHFYREITGQDPVSDISVDRVKENRLSLQPWRGPAEEFIKNEPFLAFSLAFVILKVFTYLLPKITFQFKTFWMLFARRHFHLHIFGDLSQLFGRVLHVIDLKKAWSKLSLSNKTRNFRKGAKSARVWASSLASVSLGDPSSSSRSALSDS